MSDTGLPAVLSRARVRAWGAHGAGEYLISRLDITRFEQRENIPETLDRDGYVEPALVTTCETE